MKLDKPAADVRADPRPIPRQRSAGTVHPRVTTFFDGSRWSYRVEGQPDLGHRYADRAQAEAGGRFLAQSLGAEHVIEDESGAVAERVDCSRVCDCHPRHGARPGA